MNYKNLNIEDLQQIERSCKIWKDSRNEKTNTRRTFYEITKDEKYICIIKTGGEYKKYLVSQNPLSILLKL